MTVPFQLSVQLLTSAELGQSWLPEPLREMIYIAFSNHHKGTFSNGDNPRFNHADELPPYVGDGGVCCVVVATSEDGTQVPAAFGVVKPWVDTLPTLTILSKKNVTELEVGEFDDWELGCVCVNYETRFLRRGLAKTVIDALTGWLTKHRTDGVNPQRLWIHCADVNYEYWQRYGFEPVDEYLIKKGGWHAVRDFTLHTMRKHISSVPPTPIAVAAQHDN